MAGPWEDYQAAAPSAGPWADYAPASKGYLRDRLGEAGDMLGGAVKGASQIGSTLLAPYDMAKDAIGGKGLSLDSNRQRRKDVSEALTGMGAGLDSNAGKFGQIGTEVAGTLGVGGALAAPLKALSALSGRAGAGAIPMLDSLGQAVSTGGFRVGQLSGPSALAARAAGGAITGGATAGLVNPEDAGKGAMIGGALPVGVRLAGGAGQLASDVLDSGARRFMQSAIKPTIKQLQSGDAATAVQVLLENGLNPSHSGVDKLGGLIDNLDNRITTSISGSTAQIDKQKVLQALGQTRGQFARQVAPQADLTAIQATEEGFLNHPMYGGQSMSVQDAQELKRGTYELLKKKYGQLGTADTEAQKAVARGLKDEIATAVPGISDLNAQQSRLLTAREVAERRALMEMNKNPLGLAALAGSPHGMMAFMADKSALLKSLGARGMYSASQIGSGGGLLGTSPALLPYMRGGLLASETNP